MTDLKELFASLMAARDRAAAESDPVRRRVAEDACEEIVEDIRHFQTNPELRSLIDGLLRNLPKSTPV